MVRDKNAMRLYSSNDYGLVKSSLVQLYESGKNLSFAVDRFPRVKCVLSSLAHCFIIVVSDVLTGAKFSIKLEKYKNMTMTPMSL